MNISTPPPTRPRFSILTVLLLMTIIALAITVETDQRVEIIRHRVSQKASSSTKIEDPAAGFIIWLEPN